MKLKKKNRFRCTIVKEGDAWWKVIISPITAIVWLITWPLHRSVAFIYKCRGGSVTLWLNLPKKRYPDYHRIYNKPYYVELFDIGREFKSYETFKWDIRPIIVIVYTAWIYVAWFSFEVMATVVQNLINANKTKVDSFRSSEWGRRLFFNQKNFCQKDDNKTMKLKMGFLDQPSY